MGVAVVRTLLLLTVLPSGVLCSTILTTLATTTIPTPSLSTTTAPTTIATPTGTPTIPTTTLPPTTAVTETASPPTTKSTTTKGPTSSKWPHSAEAKDRSTNDVVTCTNEKPDYYDKTCTATYGCIEYNDLVQDEVTFSIDVGTPDTQVKVWFFKEDSEDLKNGACTVTVDSDVFSDADELHDITTVYMTTSDKILIYRGEPFDCPLKIYYAAVVPEFKNFTLQDTPGTITFPDDGDEYLLQQRITWILNYPENYVIELNVSHLDLGYGPAPLHWKVTMNDLTNNDFLLVGLGSELLQQTDVVLYGSSNEFTLITINFPVAHIFFYSSYHDQDDVTGFTIQYKARELTDVPLTTTARPTTTVSPIGVTPSTWATLNGASPSNISDLNQDHLNKFKLAVSSMASDYINITKLDVEPPSSVQPSEVLVKQVGHCHPDMCSEDCLAYDFAIDKMTSNHKAWAFTTQELDAMLRDDRLQEHWSYIDDDCQFCEENITMNWWVAGGVALGAVVVASLIAVAAWKCTKRTEAQRSHQECEEDKRLEELERRRRSSCDVSVIGGVKGGKKMSMPFSKQKGSFSTIDSDMEEENYDTTGFTLHDPDFGYDDFGDGDYFTNGSQATNFYNNPAFEPDSPTQHNKYQQLQQQRNQSEPMPSTSGVQLASLPLKSNLNKRMNNVAEEQNEKVKSNGSILKSSLKQNKPRFDNDPPTDSDDSDGAVQFHHPNLKTNAISFQADIHNDDMGESAL